MVAVILSIVSAGGLAFVVYLLRGAILDRIAAGQTEAALRLETEHLAAKEKADAAARAARAKELDEEASKVHDAAGAADLLRKQFGSPGPSAPPH